MLFRSLVSGFVFPRVGKNTTDRNYTVQLCHLINCGNVKPIRAAKPSDFDFLSGIELDVDDDVRAVAADLAESTDKAPQAEHDHQPRYGTLTVHED